MLVQDHLASATDAAATGGEITEPRLDCAASRLEVECAVAQLTDVLLAFGDERGAMVVAGTAGCGEGSCWIERCLLGQLDAASTSAASVAAASREGVPERRAHTG